MTNYNDGKIHGWNGGKCPVHPNTIVEGREWTGARWDAAAVYNDWKSFRGAFRVIKEHKEPREFYAQKMKTCLLSPNKPLEHLGTEWRHCDKETTGAILFREVIE